MQETTIKQIENLQTLFRNGHSLRYTTLQNLDLRSVRIQWSSLEIDSTTTFLGCLLPLEEEIQLIQQGAIVIRSPQSVPYNPFRNTLYQWQELMEGYSSEKDESTDLRIYQHFSASRYKKSINEALWQRIHDHAIDDALAALLAVDDSGLSQKKCVGFMGGHGIGRNEEDYQRTAHCAKLLTEAGYFIVSGGGPGTMEAANLGAYLAGIDPADFASVLHTLAQAPTYVDQGFNERALQVLEQYPKGKSSLAIPTWFYGHEPSNLFASHIAKYFSNSIREDTLLAIAHHGVVFARGSAGTRQEIFMDAAQNHYGTFNYYSPMIFLGRQFYEIDTLLYPLLKQVSFGKEYHDLLHITDHPVEVLEFLQSNPPQPKNPH